MLKGIHSPFTHCPLGSAANLTDQQIQNSQEETLIDWTADENPPNKVDLAINTFEALSMEEKETIAARMGTSGMAQDFHNA